MAQVYAAKKGTSFLRANIGKFAILAIILYIGYKVSGAVRGLPSLPSLPKSVTPSFSFPQFPDVVGMISDFFMQTPPAPPTYPHILPPDTPLPNMGIPLTLEQVPLSMMMTPSMYFGPGAQAPSSKFDPSRIMPDTRKIDTMLDMGLAIDMPTKMGMPTMVNKIADAIPRVRAGNVSVMGTSLTALHLMNPNLTASQLADLRSRILMDAGTFDFGTNTGSGRGAMRTNPVLAAYENYRAMYA